MTAAAILMHPLANVRRFLAWWGTELSELAAAKTLPSRAWKVMFLRSEKGCDVYLRTRDRIELLGTATAGGDPPLTELRRRLGRQKVGPAQIVLRLRPGEVVQSRLTVPAAASDVLEPIVRNQIERLAPWPVDKALFAYEIASPANGGSQALDIALAVTARSLVEGLVAELDGFGFAPGVVDYGADASTAPRLNLLAARTDAGRRTGRLLLASVGVLCLVSLLVCAVGIVAVAQRTRQLDTLSAKLQELRGKTAAELPNQASSRRQAWLAAQKLAQPSMAIALEALSRALPDDAWLDRLEIEEGIVRMAGNAANAAALIGQIEASGHFSEVQFSAPTTLAEGDKHESFAITAKIVAGRKLD